MLLVFARLGRCNHRRIVRYCAFSQRFSSSRVGFDDYDKEKLSARALKIPPKFNFASQIIDAWARKEKTGERISSNPALWFVFEDGREVKWNFQELERDTKRVANMLERSCGIRRGDNVLVMLPKVPEFWLLSIAAMRIGIVLCPTTMQATAKDLAYRLKTLRPSFIVAHETVAEIVDQVSDCCPTLKSKIIVSSNENSERKNWLSFHSFFKMADSIHECADTDSDETMLVFFTSGTTGNPKMVEHTHSSYGMAHDFTGRYCFDLTSNCILWCLSDTGWVKVFYACLGSWLCGACLFIHEMPRFKPKQIIDILCKYPIDTFGAPPMVYRMLVEENLNSYKFKNLVHCAAGGESLSPDVSKIWEANTGVKIYQIYGQSETTGLIGMYKCIKYKYDSMGKAVPALDIVIIDDKENEVAPGVEGEIAIKRTSDRIFGLFKGYKNEPEFMKKVLTAKYYHTGDLAYRDEEDYFYFVGRKDDVINSAGYRIGPTEVESALMDHPAVVEVAVVSSPDQERGEVVKAFIVLSDSYKNHPKHELIKDLQEHAKRTTAPYKYPRKIEFMEYLPKTTSGKIKRFDLRNREWNLK